MGGTGHKPNLSIYLESSVEFHGASRGERRSSATARACFLYLRDLREAPAPTFTRIRFHHDSSSSVIAGSGQLRDKAACDVRRGRPGSHQQLEPVRRFCDGLYRYRAPEEKVFYRVTAAQSGGLLSPSITSRWSSAICGLGRELDLYETASAYGATAVGGVFPVRSNS
jgi:hypothetical protein